MDQIPCGRQCDEKLECFVTMKTKTFTTVEQESELQNHFIQSCHDKIITHIKFILKLKLLKYTLLNITFQYLHFFIMMLLFLSLSHYLNV